MADPYDGDDAGFTEVVEQVGAAVPGLLAHVRARAGPPGHSPLTAASTLVSESFASPNSSVVCGS